jgi:hypothetical protein
MQFKPWMKYTGAGVAGLIVGAAIAGSGSSQTKTVASTTTSPPKTVVQTPPAEPLPAL